MVKNYFLNFSGIISVLFFILFINTATSQIEIASQRFHNGNPAYQFTIADKDEVYAPDTQTITAHVGTDNWDYTVETSEGIIRIVNSSITTPASDLYCLEMKNYWDEEALIEFAEIDISNFDNVTFSIAYQSLGDPDNKEDLWLDYSYFDAGNWVETTVRLIKGKNNTADTLPFGTAGTSPNPFEVTIPNTATLFKADIRAEFETGAGGNDNYYIDDVILSGTPTTVAPNAICSNDFSINLDAFGNASITANAIDNGSTTVTGSITLSIDKTDFTCADLGPNLITLTVDDGIQTSTCTTTVTVNGYAGPMIAPTLPNITSFCSYTAIAPASISYQCGSIAPTTTDVTTFSTPGTYSVTWNYYDPITGNSVNAVQNITLSNLVAPTGITITTIGADTATISWDEQVGVDSYEIKYKKDGLINWFTVTSTTNTFVLTGLNQLTDYNVQVSGVCNTATVYSATNNFTTIGNTYCVPDVPNTSNRRYIWRVRLGDLAQNIDNNQGYGGGYDNGYGDYTNHSADLYKDNTYTLQLNVRNQNNAMGYSVWIDFNGDGDLEDAGEHVWFIGNTTDADPTNNTTNATYLTAPIYIPSYAVTGTTLMRVGMRRYWYPDDPCSGASWGQPGEYEDYLLNLQIEPDSPQEIDITGNGNLIADNSGVAELDTENNTDFGTYDIYEVPLVKTYVITNNGSDPLVLNGTPLVQFLSNSGDFTLTQPNISTLAIGESTTFTITFNPTSITVPIKQATVIIYNDDLDFGDDEEEYTFLVQGEAVETFGDTDGDGVPDNIDGDDDNDGILDATENSACQTYSYASQVETVFLNETFGSGYDRIQVSESSEGGSTDYCFEDGTASCGATIDLQDGSYTIYYQSSNGNGGNQTPNEDVASWADNLWYNGLDHTDDSIDGLEPGRMLLVNADYDPGVFYSATINGVTPGVEVVYGFSVLNLFKVSGAIKPQVAIAVYDPNGVQIASASSGLIEATNPSNPDGDWVTLETTFTSTSSQFTIQLINDQVGGYGNDLAIDDIYVKQILCDQDNDGVPDSIDLDNDNDGIPNIVELGLPDGDKDATLFGDGWMDANGNGVHDSYEGGAALIDTDGDGIPNFIDIDSDNDGIFDTVEYDGYGDIDVNGNGVGEGSDANSGTDNDAFDGDGILGLNDLNDGDIDANDHGSANYPTPQDTDGDGIPNYLDIDSNDATNNPLNGSDIDTTVYGYLDANNDGVIDGTADIDQDGILDTFDTDTNLFGSPRDLDDSYSLFFDGRNDYVEEGSVINGWANAAIMSWIKIEPTASGDRVIVGQNGFRLIVKNDGTPQVIANGVTLSSSEVLPSDIWVHIASVYDSNNGALTLYVNGKEAASTSVSGNLPVDTSSLTIGRTPDTNSNFFKGEIDEVRIFDAALNTDEIQKMVYQELDENHNFNRGKIVPKDIAASFSSSLKRYYKMDAYKDDILDDKTTMSIDQTIGAKLYNIKNIYYQTAPLPYVSTQDGDWTAEATWLHGNVWDITDATNNKDWSIVDIKHNITTSNSHKSLGLFINDSKTLTVNGDHEVNNSWYLNLDGTIDLQDDSQLIQGIQSDLVTSVNGKILRRQEGQVNVFRYNYWSSPVGQLAATAYLDNNASINNPNNTSYTLDMLKEGTGSAVQFTNSHHEVGKVSTAWLYAFENGVTYYDWNHLSTNEAISSGLGYTQKGTGNTGTSQQYIFEGKPNNGTIILDAVDTGGAGSVEAVSKTSTLLGNPYPSAIDARQFISDNEGVIDGTILLWEQWAGSSHTTVEYEGGYAYINNLTTVKAAQYPYNSNSNALLGGTKRPSFYIPVSQGFFVEVVNDGNIEFNNNQRVFIKESDALETDPNVGSTFFKTSNSSPLPPGDSENNYQLIRLELSMSDNSSRTMVLGFDASFTDQGREYGYDGGLVSTPLSNDLGSLLNDEQYIIQALAPITADKVVDLTFTATGTEIYTIKNVELANIAESQEIYLRDNLLGVYFDLREEEGYSFTSEAGTFNDRFDVLFNSGSTLATEEFEALNEAIIYFSNTQETLFVKGLKEGVKQLTLYNTLGQIVLSKQNVSTSILQNGMAVSNLSTGLYVVSIKTENNTTIDKKIIIE